MNRLSSVLRLVACLVACQAVLAPATRAADTTAGAQDLVARIADHELTVSDFERRARELRRSGYKHITEPDFDSKLELLDGIVVRHLLALEGERRGLDADPEITAEVAKTRQRALMHALYEDQALEGDYTAHTERELRDFFRDHEYDAEVLTRHIVVDTEARAREALQALQAGTPFRDAVKSHSRATIQRRFGPEGWVGWFKIGELYEELREPMKTMPEDSLWPEPVKTALGWHVFGLRVRRPVTFEAAEPFLREQLRIQKRADDMEAYVNALRRRYDLEMHGGGLALLRAVPADSLEVDGGGRDLVTWKDGGLTVQGYLDQVAARRAPHPAELDSATTHKAVDNLAGRFVMVAEAERLGLDTRPEVREKIWERRTALMVERLYLDVTSRARSEFTEQELRAFYAGNEKLYTRKDGAVTPFEQVRGSIHTFLENRARTVLMDDFVARLRQRYGDRVEVYSDVLDSLAFASTPLLPVRAQTGVDGDEGQQF